jgi:hypothetical protein
MYKTIDKFPLDASGITAETVQPANEIVPQPGGCPIKPWFKRSMVDQAAGEYQR